MNDQELRDKLASEYALSKFPMQNIETAKNFTQDVNFARRMSHDSAFKAGWDAARANPLPPDWREEQKYFKAEIINLQKERDQLRAEVERLKGLKTITDLAKTITGHDPTDIAHQISETNQLRAEVERLKATRTFSLLRKTQAERDSFKAQCEKLYLTGDKIGGWMSAALDDKSVCAEMKADIRPFLEALAEYRKYTNDRKERK